MSFKICLSAESPSRVTYTGIALPHCTLVIAQSWILLHPWPHPQVATPGKCVSPKFRCCFISLSPAAASGRHKPLLRTFTGIVPDQHCRQKYTIRELIRTKELRRTKWVSATPIREPKFLWIKAKIKSDVCVSYSFFSIHGFFKPVTMITDPDYFSECRNALFIADICHLNGQK